MTRLTIIILFIMRCIQLNAQPLQLRSVTMTMDPMTTAMQRLDANGNVCGLVKVILPNPGVSFEGNLIGNAEYKTSEYWCYLSPNTRFLKIKYPNLDPLMIDFTEFFSNGIQSKLIYEVNILIPHRIQSTGVPIRLKLETQSDFYYPRAYKECEVRGILVGKLDFVDVYLNIQNGKYDYHVRVENENFKECLLGDVHKGDIITVIPNKDTFAKKSITVVDSVITKRYLNFKIPRQGINKSGRFIDDKTQKPIENVSVEFYNLNISFGSEKFLYGSAKTDKEGKFVIKNCFSHYIYHVRASSPGYKFESFDIKADTTISTYKLTPNMLNIKIFDGKKPIEGVKLTCNNISNSTFYTDATGSVEIIGAMDKTFTISHSDYETIVVTREWDTNMVIKMKKGDATLVKEAIYDSRKDKLIFK